MSLGKKTLASLSDPLPESRREAVEKEAPVKKETAMQSETAVPKEADRTKRTSKKHKKIFDSIFFVLIPLLAIILLYLPISGGVSGLLALLKVMFDEDSLLRDLLGKLTGNQRKD